MINKLLQIIAPHYCYKCQKIGSVLCDNCKYDIADEMFTGCIVCTRSCRFGICSDCRTTYDRAWCVGERDGSLRLIIDDMKFRRNKDASAALGDLLHYSLPKLPDSTIVVPIPTVPSHIRVRGYDHTLLIARRFARQRKMQHSQLLTRVSNERQRGASKSARADQAKRAFNVTGPLDPEATYLIIDDIVTTNATLRYAAQQLKNAGVKHVWVAVIARQPLDK